MSSHHITQELNWLMSNCETSSKQNYFFFAVFLQFTIVRVEDPKITFYKNLSGTKYSCDFVLNVGYELLNARAK